MDQYVKEPFTNHQEVSLLLPWYVNKTLQDAGLKELERHLSVCLYCQRELIRHQELAQAVVKESSPESYGQVTFLRPKKTLAYWSAIQGSGQPETSAR